MGLGIFSTITHLGFFGLYFAFIVLLIKGFTGDGRWALLLVTFLIPLRSVLSRLQSLPLSNQIIDILIFAALVGCIFYSPKVKRQFPAPSILNPVIVILVIYTFFSLLIGNNYLHHTFALDFSDTRTKDWKNFCLMPLLFFITFNHITDRVWIIRVLLTMALGIIVADSDLLVQIRDHPLLMDREKITGTFQFLGPNEVAAFVNEYAILMMGIFFFVKRKLVKWPLFVLICMNIFCVFFLYSRGAYVGLLAGMFFLFLFKNRKFLILLILLIVFWQVILPQNVIERIKETKDENGQLDTSSQRRINIWAYSIDLFKQSPIVGIGKGVFAYLGLDLGDTHNIYVKYLVEQGLVGFIIFLTVLFCFLRMGYILYKKGEDDFNKGMGLGLMGCVVVLMVNNLFGDRWTYLELSAYLWVFAGLVARLIIMPQEAGPLPEVQEKGKFIPASSIQKKKKKVRYYDL